MSDAGSPVAPVEPSTGPVEEGPVADVEAPAPRRGFGSVPDLLRSMAVVLVLVAAVLVLVPRPNTDAVITVDPAPTLAQARAGAPFTVQAPVGLPSTWRVTSARFDRRADGAYEWHEGFYTPQDAYAAVEQSDAPAADFVIGISARGLAQPPVVVAGVTWQQVYSAVKKQRTLFRTVGGSTLGVTGTSTLAELETLAAALR